MAAVDCPVLNEAASQPTELNDLQDHALGAVGKLQADAQAEADALQGQATEQLQALHQQAQAKADELKGRADALRNRAAGMPGEAMNRATAMRDHATGQANAMRDQAIGQANAMRDQAISRATAMRDQAMGRVNELRNRATGLRDQAMQMHARAQGMMTQMKSAPEMAKAKAFETASQMRDQATGMLQMPPACSALMEESAGQPLPDKERARAQDLAPYEDEEPEEQAPGGQEQEEEKPMGMEAWLQKQLQRRLELAAERALARAKEFASSLGLPTDFPPPGSGFDMHQAMSQELDHEQQAMQDHMDKQMGDMHPEAPPYDDETSAALAGFGQCSDMLKDLIGKSLTDDNGVGEMQELVGSFGDCMAAIPPIDPAQLNAMNVVGSMAKMVEDVRAKFNVDMLMPGAGAQLADMLNKARNFDPNTLREAAARRAAQWLPLSSFAQSLQLPVNGPGALGRLGEAAKWMQTVPMPDTQAAAALMSHMDNAAAVKRVFESNPFSKGAAAAIAPKLEQVRANAEQAMSRAQGAARQAQGIAGQLSRSSLAQVAKIDRSQARDMALGKIRSAATPMLAKAMPVLSTLRSVRDATGKKVTLPGSGRWRGRRS